MGHQVRSHAPIDETYQVKSRRMRRQGEVSDADEVSIADVVLMLLKSIERTAKQMRIDLTVDTGPLSEGRLCTERARSNACKRKIDEKTTGDYQDA